MNFKIKTRGRKTKKPAPFCAKCAVELTGDRVEFYTDAGVHTVCVECAIAPYAKKIGGGFFSIKRLFKKAA
jgi:hypothetical protein